MVTGAAADPAVALQAEEFAARPVPVLRATVASLAGMAQREDAVKPREVARAVLRDPMLSLSALRYLRTHHSRRMLEDITTIEHAVLMLGMRRFLSAFNELPVVEEVLAGNPPALAGLMQVIGRARAAAIYAGALAALRADIAPDQVVAAALLNDLAEMLLWCFEPERAAAIAARLAAQPGLRSADAQRQVLGFRLIDLQLTLARRWDLPELFLSLMDDTQADKPRVRNVSLSVALARHTSHGWRNPALRSDLEGIARFLRSPVEEAAGHVFEAALRVIADRDWCGAGLPGAHLPPLPGPALLREAAGTPEDLASVYEAAHAWLARLARRLPAHGHPRGGLLRDARHEQLAAVAALMDGMTGGLGFAYGLFLVPDSAGTRWHARFVGGGDGGGQCETGLKADRQAMAAVAKAIATRSPVAHAGVPGDGEDRLRGLFAWPVTAGEGTCAVAVALEPVATACLEPECFDRFKELGAGFDAALRGVDEPPFWCAIA
jgi:HD-like signal output (HDOD) protein